MQKIRDLLFNRIGETYEIVEELRRSNSNHEVLKLMCEIYCRDVALLFKLNGGFFYSFKEEDYAKLWTNPEASIMEKFLTDSHVADAIENMGLGHYPVAIFEPVFAQDILEACAATEEKVSVNKGLINASKLAMWPPMDEDSSYSETLRTLLENGFDIETAECLANDLISKNDAQAPDAAKDIIPEDYR